MGRVQIALAGGLALLVGGVVLVSVQRPSAVARANGVKPEATLARITSHARLCQARELVPARTTAIAAWIGAFTGPRVSTELVVDGHVLARGERGPGWSGRSVTIPLNRALRHATLANVCFSVAPKYEVALPRGNVSKTVAAATFNGKKLGGPMTIEYLRPGHGTWLSRASTIVHHMGLGRFPSGDWAPILAIVLMLTVIAVASDLVVSGPDE